jgi:DNA-binding CsgD family transcriptional regulator
VKLGLSGSLSLREVDACRRVLVEEKSVEEAARILNLTETSVRMALKRAKMVIDQSL